jgi:hypothetical protein
MAINDFSELTLLTNLICHPFEPVFGEEKTANKMWPADRPISRIS